MVDQPYNLTGQIEHQPMVFQWFSSWFSYGFPHGFPHDFSFQSTSERQAVAKKGQVELQPLGVTAVAALDKLAPQLLADGSTPGATDGENHGCGAVLGAKTMGRAMGKWRKP